MLDNVIVSGTIDYTLSLTSIMPRHSKAEELLDFEITFYEKLLRAYPDFVDALIPLGHAYTQRGLFDRGLQVDLRLIALRGDDPLTWYNLACSYSLLNRLDESLKALRRAFELGYSDLAALQKDQDLKALRQSPQFRDFLATYSAQLAAKAEQPAS